MGAIIPLGKISGSRASGLSIHKGESWHLGNMTHQTSVADLFDRAPLAVGLHAQAPIHTPMQGNRFMNQPNPGLLHRISLAFSSFFAILAQPEWAGRVEKLRAGAPDVPPEPVQPVVATAPAPQMAPVVQAVPHAAALQLLGLLQRDARFIDFIQEDVKAYTDAEIGAAGRVVHEGCRKVLRDHFTIEPVRPEPEGSRVTLPAGFDAAAVRLTGQVVGQPPFAGSLSHRGWRVTDSRLPKLALAHDASIVAQAEVEL